MAVRDIESFGRLEANVVYNVLSGSDNLVEIGEFTYYDHRFELYKEKQMKLKDIIKPFMRVKTRSKGIWIAVEKDGEVFLVNGNGYNFIEELGEYGDGCDGYDIVEVYSAPYYIHDYLRFDKFGGSVWKLQPFKSAQQIAVEELEASIKASQEKLEQLKRSL